MTDDMDGKEIGNVIRIDEARIKDHLGEMVRGTDLSQIFNRWFPFGGLAFRSLGSRQISPGAQR